MLKKITKSTEHPSNAKDTFGTWALQLDQVGMGISRNGGVLLGVLM